MLDHFMPTYDVVERHHVTVGAPPAVTLAAARDQELMSNRVIRVIFKARELGPEQHTPAGLDAVGSPADGVVDGMARSC